MPELADARLIELLLKLYREGDRWFRALQIDDWRRREIRTLMVECRVKPFAHADEVRATLTQYAEQKISRPHKAFPIEPWLKSADALFLLEPVFQPSADGASRKLSLYLGAIVRENEHRHFMGYRYEGPEGGESHNFYHAQPIIGFDGSPTPFSISWHPDKWPTHSLAAKNDVQLLLALMLAFQGMARVKSHGDVRSLSSDDAKQFLQGLIPAAAE